MKPIEISLQGFVDAVLTVFTVIFCIVALFAVGVVAWQEAGMRLLWQIPAALGGTLVLLVIVSALHTLYEKNPTIKIGGRPKKARLPKAKVL